MANLRVSEWRKLPVSLTELCLDTTLRCGQSFRWKEDNGKWSCALHGRILSLRQDSTHLHYQVIWPKANTLPLTSSSPTKSPIEEDADSVKLIRHYFNLAADLSELYAKWSLADPNFKKKAPSFTGVRILKQDAWEALVSFICSSNNNIARISQMVNNLCLHYGPLIGHINGQAFHGFPSSESLASPNVEAHLKELGFGYRAKYLARTAVIVAKEKPLGWLDSLRNTGSVKDEYARDIPMGGRAGYRRAHYELLELQGVGPKVADCVCLMGLGWSEALPVDTHVWQIAQRDYRFGKAKHKSLTKATYDAIGDYFRGLWGEEAGWAHSVLFAADLRTFAAKLATEAVVESNGVDIKQGDDITRRKISSTKRELEANTQATVEAPYEGVTRARRTKKLKR